MLLTRSPLYHRPRAGYSFDLHVLGTPPAFILSQDQTLHRNEAIIVASHEMFGPGFSFAGPPQPLAARKEPTRSKTVLYWPVRYSRTVLVSSLTIHSIRLSRFPRPRRVPLSAASGYSTVSGRALSSGFSKILPNPSRSPWGAGRSPRRPKYITPLSGDCNPLFGTFSKKFGTRAGSRTEQRARAQGPDPPLFIWRAQQDSNLRPSD